MRRRADTAEHAVTALPDSPCVRSCCLDDGDICLGCGRHLDEILGWHQADAVARERILASARQRLQERRRPR
jgi:predicted Fe-S protein YdhL (DUF1289 family)